LGFDSITSVFLDSTNGIVRGFLNYNLDQPVTYPELPDPDSATGVSLVSGLFYLEGALQGDSNGPIDIVLEMRVGTSMSIQNGEPYFVLGTGLGAFVFSTPVSGNNYSSSNTFSSNPSVPPAEFLQQELTATVEPIFDGTPSTYDDTSVELISDDFGELQFIHRMTVPVQSGDSIYFVGNLIAGLGPELDIADNDGSDGVDVLPGEGTIDVSNSALFRILLPEGFSLSGDDPLLDNIVLVNGSESDADSDGIVDNVDNCILIANAEQTDTDNDGYGNACDADYNNDCIVNFIDISQFAPQFLGTNPLYDSDNDGNVNFVDFSSLTAMYLLPPGPGLADGICNLN
jgi:hypothetical protein